jgi:hypothetical protein
MPRDCGVVMSDAKVRIEGVLWTVCWRIERVQLAQMKEGVGVFITAAVNMRSGWGGVDGDEVKCR